MRGIRGLIAFAVILTASFAQAWAANEPSTSAVEQDIRELAEQVDVLQLIDELNLTEKQLTYMAGKIEALRKGADAALKREEAILKDIKDPLQKTKEYLVAGKDVPDSISTVTSGKLKELQEIRQQSWQQFQSAASSCVQQLDEGQVRVIARSPAALKRARQILQQIRSASESTWPSVLDSVATELVEVKKIDKQVEWQTELQQIEDLTGEERTNALKDFEERKEASVAEMKSEVTKMLTNIRGADSRILSIAVNNLASAVRSKTEVQLQIFNMMSRILDSPQAEAMIKARLAAVSEATAK